MLTDPLACNYYRTGTVIGAENTTITTFSTSFSLYIYIINLYKIYINNMSVTCLKFFKIIHWIYSRHLYREHLLCPSSSVKAVKEISYLKETYSERAHAPEIKLVVPGNDTRCPWAMDD